MINDLVLRSSNMNVQYILTSMLLEICCLDTATVQRTLSAPPFVVVESAVNIRDIEGHWRLSD